MRKFVIFAALLIVLAACRSLPEPDFSPGQPCLKVVSYNINWAVANAQNVVDYLGETDADVVCLQETNRKWEAILRARLEGRYRHCVFEGWGGAGGIAIMSRYRLQKVRLIKPGAGWFPALLAEAQTPIGLIQVLNVHLRPALSDRGTVSVSAMYNTPEIHLEELRGFVAETDADRPLIIAGDFNEDENGRAVQWLLNEGFTDALSSYDAYSKTWSYEISYGLALKARYDHIVVSRQLRCTGARVTAVEASDHVPAMAVIVPGTSE